MILTNYFEQRLHQIEILLHAYRSEDGKYEDEIQDLEEERTSILLHLKYKD